MKTKYSPCYKCEKRVPECHSDCEAYEKYSNERKNDYKVFHEEQRKDRLWTTQKEKQVLETRLKRYK